MHRKTMKELREQCKYEVARNNNFDSFEKAIRYLFNRQLLQSEEEFLNKIIDESMILFTERSLESKLSKIGLTIDQLEHGRTYFTPDSIHGSKGVKGIVFTYDERIEYLKDFGHEPIFFEVNEVPSDTPKVSEEELIIDFADWRDVNEDWILRNCRDNKEVTKAYLKLKPLTE